MTVSQLQSCVVGFQKLWCCIQPEGKASTAAQLRAVSKGSTQMPNTRTRQRCRSSQRILRRCNTEKQGLSSLHGHTHPCMCYCLLPLYARILNTTLNPDGEKAGLFVFLPQKERSLECLRACFQGCVCSGLLFCFFLIACQLLRLFSDQPCSFTHSYFIELLYYQQ